MTEDTQTSIQIDFYVDPDDESDTLQAVVHWLDQIDPQSDLDPVTIVVDDGTPGRNPSVRLTSTPGTIESILPAYEDAISDLRALAEEDQSVARFVAQFLPIDS